MVTVRLDASTLHLTVEGMDKVWAIKSQLDIPLAHIAGVTRDPDGIHDWWKGLKLGGTAIGHFMAGTFLYHGDRVFWDVHDPDNAIGIDLHDERFKTLVIEVEAPNEVVEMIRAALPFSSG